MSKPTLIVIAGPTASGKTATAIEVAKSLNTVIINADSRQFYKEMSIGTAVPTPKELQEVKHYFVQHISILDNYDVAAYEKDVMILLRKLFMKHDQVVLTGGSGLFIDAVCKGIDAMPDIDKAVRQKVEQLYRDGGLTALQQEVQRLDPEYWAIVDWKNPRRLQRALEVCYQTGKTFTSFRTSTSAKRDFDIVKYALLWDKQQLYNRINLRVEQMLSQGLVEEARRLYPYRRRNALNTVGYKELFEYFDGNINLMEAIEQIKLNTRHYAKRQMTWLRRDQEYNWINPSMGERITFPMVKPSAERQS
ncbi:MAG: tRNA (adenosine(37)-N6)-dimethylallyltransferase MiaA [Bacteroidales bacterium]|nr:tRNA (adenosine(37)-N6)-dimethylallyltransferase MiaA [Bacteroidales bacterium]